MITAWMTIFVLVFHYVLAYNPRLSPFRDPSSPDPQFVPNMVDVSLLNLTSRLRSALRIKGFDGSGVEELLNKARPRSRLLRLLVKTKSNLCLVCPFTCRRSAVDKHFHPYKRVLLVKPGSIGLPLANGRLPSMVLKPHPSIGSFVSPQIFSPEPGKTSLAYLPYDTPASSLSRGFPPYWLL